MKRYMQRMQCSSKRSGSNSQFDLPGGKRERTQQNVPSQGRDLIPDWLGARFPPHPGPVLV